MTVVGVAAGQLTVERAMVATLEQWLPSYVVAAARRYAAEGAFGLTVDEMAKLLTGGGLPFAAKGVTVAKSFEDWPVDALPHLQVISPSWAPAGGDQDGKTFKYQIQVACLVGAQTADDTRLLRACYEDAIVGVGEQQKSLGGVAQGVDVVGGGAASFTEISGSDERTFQGSLTVFEVTLQRVIQPHEGPVLPLPDPVEGVPPVWPADPTVDEDGAEATVVPEDLT